MIHSAELVLPMTGNIVKNGAVVVEDGRVVDVTTGRGDVHHEGVLVAGLVNAHTHLQYTCMAEVGQRVYPDFDAWARVFNDVYFGSADGSWDPMLRKGAWDWAASALDGAWQCLRSGTTSVADIVTDLEALVDSPLGGVRYLEAIGDSDTSWASGGRARFEGMLDGVSGISPHAPYSLDTGVLAELAELARDRGMRLHIHLAESPHEHEFTTAATGPLRRFVDELGFGIVRDGGSGLAPVDYLDSLGLLGPDCHIAHGVHLTAHDRSLLRTRETAVALCPRSNRVLGLDGPDVAALLREGNPIAVGTDSLSSSPSLDLLADVAALRDLAVRQGYRDGDLDRRLVEAATLGGAAAMGLTGEIGCLAPGARADFAVFDIDPGAREPYRTLIEKGQGRCVATFVGGSDVGHMGTD
ncbi:amidohydrolase family protein [Nonomuraea sp. NPDC050556]|uniref:amidohydrolase family protein n=1 Tax=Nonomuraea sp. NPDC050556 TaxID=3364369 RepID=UPI0037A7258C